MREGKALQARAGVLAGGIALVEWPDRLGSLLPPERLDIALSFGPEATARRPCPTERASASSTGDAALKSAPRAPTATGTAACRAPR